MVRATIRKEQNMTEKYKIHAFYILFILMTVIIMLATIKWASIPTLTEYITFGLTLTSLILAILAIIYAFLSNSSFAATISQINASASAMSSVKEEVKRATEALTVEVATLPRALAGLSSQVGSTYALVSQLTQPSPAYPSGPEFNADPTFIQYFLDRISVTGTLTLYACAFAHKRNVTFNRKDLSAAVRALDEDYVYGFLVASSSARIMDYDQSGDNLTINQIDPILESKSRDRFVTLAKNMDNPTFQQWAMEDLDSVEKYIASIPSTPQTQSKAEPSSK